MQRDVGYTIGLQWVYWVMYLVLFGNVIIILMSGPAQGALLDDPRVDRVISFRWFWLHCQSFGFSSPFITLWLMYHTWYDIFYWVHMGVVCLSAVAQILFGAMLLIDNVFIHCVGLCDGQVLPGAEYGTKPDWSLIVFTCMVGAQFLCNCVYVVFNFYLHRRTEARVLLEAVAANRAPPLSRAYMQRARYGGFRTFYDAFAPPGQHSLAFDPSTGEAAQVFSKIGDEINSSRSGLISAVRASTSSSLPDSNDTYIPIGAAPDSVL